VRARANLPERIFLNGKIIKASRNLRGIREYVCMQLVKFIDIAYCPAANGVGSLLVHFKNGAIYHTEFADFSILRNWVRDWRSVYGSPLWVNGVRQGVVSKTNP